MDLTKPRVVIVGGGFAGIAAARALRRAEANVVVIDKHNHHLFQPLLYQVATAALHPGNVAAPIRGVMSGQKNCRVLMNEVEDVDLESQTVMLGGEPYTYDYLVVAAGLETNYFGNDAWKEHAPGLKTIDEATDIRARFLLAFEQAEFEQDKAAKRAALTFAIVGAGPTGVEMAGALAEIADNVRKDFRSIDTRTTRIIVLDFADRVLTSFPEDLSERARVDLESLGVEVILQTRVTGVDANGLDAETPDGPIRIDANNVFWAAGVKASPITEKLGAELDRSGRVVVEGDLSIPGHPNTFVAGDLALSLDPVTGEPVPGVAQGALQGGEFVGRTIAAEIKADRRGGRSASASDISLPRQGLHGDHRSQSRCRANRKARFRRLLCVSTLGADSYPLPRGFPPQARRFRRVGVALFHGWARCEAHHGRRPHAQDDHAAARFSNRRAGFDSRERCVHRSARGLC